MAEFIHEGRKIITHFDYPPIPIRNCDWSAVFDDYDGAEDSNCTIGRGATEKEAIEDLLCQEDERAATPTPRKEHPMTDNALALIEPKNAAQYFTANGLDPVIEKIREQVSDIVPDISTERGRAEIRSLAFKVAKSKTALDDMGKQLVSGMREQVKAIDAERRRAWDEIEAIQHEVRAPLTEWENAEKERVAKHEANITQIILGGRNIAATWQTSSVQWMGENLAAVEADAELDWQEFGARAKQAIDEATTAIREAIAKRKAYDAEQAELARLRKEEAERKQREHEERIAAEAAAKAKAEAEEQARMAAEAEAARVRVEQEKADRERQRIQREKEAAERDKAEAEARARQAEDDRLAAETARRAAEERAEHERLAAIAQAEEKARQAEADRLAAIEQAEADRKAAKEKAERDRVAAAEQAKREAEAAAQAERDRIAAEQKAEADALAKREADKKHRAKIEKDAINGLMLVGLSLDVSRLVLGTIARGEVPNVKITY